MEFGILGPLEVTEDGRQLALGGTKQRSLLAMLLLHANEAVARDRLIEALWDGQPPGSAATALQVYVSQLRKVLDPGADRGEELVTRRPATRCRRARPARPAALRTPAGRRACGARSAEAETARRLLAEALALWRGAPLADLDTCRSPSGSAPASRSCGWPRSRSESRPTWRSAGTPSSCRSSRRSSPSTRCASGCAAS